MKALVAAWLVLIGAFAIATSCSVNHRSGEFECSKASDCSNGRECINGYCVVPGGEPDAKIPDGKIVPDADVCPSQCTSCNIGAMTCTIDCSHGADCGHQLVCPDNWNCNILCNVSDACRSGIDCTGAASCALTCSGNRSCDQVVCGPGKCSVNCSGPGTCRGVNCGQACACDVMCGGLQSCFDPGVICPPSSTFNSCNAGLGCTSQPNGCNHC